jgi:hypothetical protein
MKKTLLTLCFAIVSGITLNAQSVIFDNGPIFNLAAGGSGGSNVSSLHDGMTTYGAGHALSTLYRVADDIIIGANTTWTIDTLVFYGYQTGSGNVSSIDHVNVRIWDGPPGAPSNIVWGDSTTNLLITSEFSGTYRTGDVGNAACAPATCIDRPIMRNAAQVGTTLTTGTYWIDWQTGGALASGPWAPPINLGAGATTTGNAKQYNPTTALWVDLADGALTAEFQGLPFLVVGNITTGLSEVSAQNSVSVYPNPVANKGTVSIKFPVSREDNITFTVYNVIGEEMLKMENIATQQFEFNRGNLQNGIYIYELKKGNSTLKNGKLIIQ